MPNRALITATRVETSYTLNILHGAIPTDWYGHVFINSPVGTAASGGLPYAKDSQEWGSPIMNGDGYVFRLDLGNEAKVQVTTALMKPPCFYADEATIPGNPGGYTALEEFRSTGITRMSYNLGLRNQLNTSVTPFQFPGDPAPRMLACYDAGKPWEIGTTDLRMITALGANSEYTAGTPGFLFPFPPISTTAHPSFDPHTGELFLVNFIHPPEMRNPFGHLANVIKEDVEKCETFLEKVLDDLDHHSPLRHLIDGIKGLCGKHTEPHQQAALGWLHNILHSHHTALTEPVEGGESSSGSTEVFLLRWTGENAPMERWKVVDETGASIPIKQCMHQTAVTEDYIILADAAFKFSLDLMFNAPFKSAKLNSWLREKLTVPQLPYLDVFLVSRKDLASGGGEVLGRRVKTPIEQEAVHFSADYRNPGGVVTLHLAHNSAACLAEWVRTFDTKPPDGVTPVDDSVIGMMSVGCMDLGRIGKVTIDAAAPDILKQDFIHLPGNISDPAHIGPHTWGVGLYSHRGLLDVQALPDTIRYNYWYSYGLYPKLLTSFIYNLYLPYPDRIESLAEVLQLNEEGIPFVLSRQNTEKMELEDWFQFDDTVHMTSIQFVPRSPGAPQVTTDEQMDGYILLCTTVNYPNAEGDNWQCEIWIFKAWDLADGPVCRLAHPMLDYAFTLHSAWVPSVGERESSYYIDPRADYDPLIAALEPAPRQKMVQDIFDKEVYPHFPSAKSSRASRKDGIV